MIFLPISTKIIQLDVVPSQIHSIVFQQLKSRKILYQLQLPAKMRPKIEKHRSSDLTLYRFIFLILYIQNQLLNLEALNKLCYVIITVLTLIEISLYFLLIKKVSEFLLSYQVQNSWEIWVLSGKRLLCFFESQNLFTLLRRYVDMSMKIWVYFLSDHLFNFRGKSPLIFIIVKSLTYFVNRFAVLKQLHSNIFNINMPYSNY